MKQMSIRTKFLLSLLILIAAFLTLMNTYSRHMMINVISEEEENRLYKEADLIANDYISTIDFIREAQPDAVISLRDKLNALQEMDSSRFLITDADGVVLVDSNKEHTFEAIRLTSYSEDFLTHSTYSGGALNRLTHENGLYVIYPFTENKSITGYVIAFTSLDAIAERAVVYNNVPLIAFAVFILFLCIVTLFLSQEMVAPLTKLNKTVREYAKGHFDYKVPRIRQKDYMELADSMQYMADKLKYHDEYQRQFVANVSHDFRSPLTSIKGYAEALNDGTIPPELHGKYLKIITSEAQRLTKLTTNLLELNRYETHGIPLDISTFDINPVIRMCSSVFEQQCTQRKISLHLIFEKKSMQVRADKLRIEEVIQNLLDNAIKFSPHNGKIEIRVTQQSGKIFVSIKDYGEGIPKDKLSHIWERFYKVDTSRGKDKTGTGLGLAITKEIIDAHGENINVISTPGAGTEFIFSLPALEE